MKRTIAILATMMAAFAFSAFGQGYIEFGAAKNTVYDLWQTGSSVASSSEDSVTFLWSTTGANDFLGPGLPTTGGPDFGGWDQIETMIASGGWDVAYNGSFSEADVEVNSSIIGRGGVSYNGGSEFLLGGQGSAASYAPGATLDFIMIGWDNGGGTVNTLEQAETDFVQLGWDSEFTYTTGATPGVAVDATFNSSGASGFAIGVPEPTTLALAGLGGLSMLFFRRRRGDEALTKFESWRRANPQNQLESPDVVSYGGKGIVGAEVTRL